MPSERRLHPLSFLFVIAGQVRQLAVPAVVVLFGAGSAGYDWQAWLTFVIVPYAVVAILRSLSFRYRFEPAELVITTGFVFRNERHVPYGRIQNIDAVQHIPHRLLRVADVRVETGGGDEPEARMRVLPMAALEEMRERVFAGRAAAAPAAADAAASVAASAAASARRTLLALGPRELLLAGFVDSRGMIIVGAAVGLLWEFGLFDSVANMIAGDTASGADPEAVERRGRGLIRQVARGVFGGGGPSFERLLTLAAAFAVFVVVIRVLSMIWSLIRLWGFRLQQVDDDLGTEFGLLTRVMATHPRRRIQTVTIRRTPLHRLFRAASIRVDSAGSDGGEGVSVARESLAPIVREADVPRVLAAVLPDVDLRVPAWQPVDPGAYRRKLRVSLMAAVIFTLPTIALLRWWSLAWLALMVVWAFVHARLDVAALGWATGEQAVFFRSGYVTREMTIARFNKMQVVALHESPFDRRARMAGVRVDTAGAADASHRVHIPYLARSVADGLYRKLSADAARTAFRW
jgi:putative membrane protein